MQALNTEIFMVSPEGVGTQVVFALTQASKWGVCLRCPGKSVIQGTDLGLPIPHTQSQTHRTPRGQEEGK